MRFIDSFGWFIVGGIVAALAFIAYLIWSFKDMIL